MSAIRTADAALYADIQTAYKEAMARGQYKGHYAETTANEYWAEGTQWWFWSNYEWFDGTTRLQTPDDLKAYRPQAVRVARPRLHGPSHPSRHLSREEHQAAAKTVTRTEETRGSETL